MKLIPSFLTLTLASVLTFCLTPSADAQSRHRDRDGHGSHGGNSGWSGSHKGPKYGHPSSRYHGPVRLLYTREIGRRTHYQLTRNRYGRPYSQRVTTITYRATYSNGQTKIYTRTI